jgi:acetyltransferase
MNNVKLDPSVNILQPRDNCLDKMFYPKSVAIIGASEKENSVGRTLLRNLILNPFGGTVYPVNPKHKSVLGVKCYPSLSKIADSVDLAVIATPAITVPTVIEECGRKKVPAVIIISAGFRETGEEGLKLEKKIFSIAEKYQIRIIGPNCLGIINPIIGLNATFAADMALKGNIAFLSQSGALCTAVLDWSIKEKIGFSFFVSIGSMLDVSWGDLIFYFGNDPNTKSILIYMESIGDPRSFLSAAREVALTKPIILIKAGKTEESAKAAISHTGALAESNEVLNAALRRVGILRVDSISDLFSMAEILAKQPLPKGAKLSIITNAGGPGVIATDALIEMGGELAKLSESTLLKLNSFLPPQWSHNNPIDIVGDATPDRYEKTLEAVIKDNQTDGLLVILTPQNMTNPKEVAERLKKISKLSNKPLLASWMGAARVKEGIEILSDAKIPTFEYPESACIAFARMWQYSYNMVNLYETPFVDNLEIDESLLLKRNKLINSQFEKIISEKRTLLDEVESKKILEAYNIPTVPTKIAHNVDQAVHIASKMGFPVVLKLYSRTITHKKEVGGVKLNLNNREAVKKAYREIYTSIKNGVGLRHFMGVTIQPMVHLDDGYELILGSSTDPLFGPTVLFGAGGVLVEILKDSSLGLPPLSTTLAQRIMENTRIYEALKGISGKKNINLDLLISIFVEFSNLITEYPLIKECDINPLFVSSDKIIALDARFVLFDQNEKRPFPAMRPYPLEYIKFIKLNDGTSIIFRPIRPEDELSMISFLKQLSKKSIVNRYLKTFRCDELIAKERLIKMCYGDYDREITVIAELKKEGKVEILAVGRLLKGIGKKEGILSLVVKDKWQGKKIGTHLLKHLIDIAAHEKYNYIYAKILVENKIMISLCQKLGFEIVPAEDKNFVYAKIVFSKAKGQI